MWTLLGVGVVVLGFLLRFNPLLVIAAAVFVTGWAGHISPVDTIAALGKRLQSEPAREHRAFSFCR